MNIKNFAGRPKSFDTLFKDWLRSNNINDFNTIFNGQKGRKSQAIKNLEYQKEIEYNNYLQEQKKNSDDHLKRMQEEKEKQEKEKEKNENNKEEKKEIKFTKVEQEFYQMWLRENHKNDYNRLVKKGRRTEILKKLELKRKKEFNIIKDDYMGQKKYITITIENKDYKIPSLSINKLDVIDSKNKHSKKLEMLLDIKYYENKEEITEFEGEKITKTSTVKKIEELKIQDKIYKFNYYYFDLIHISFNNNERKNKK